LKDRDLKVMLDSSKFILTNGTLEDKNLQLAWRESSLEAGDD
jgi:hypothetical protein